MKPLHLLVILILIPCAVWAQKQDTINRFFKGAVNREYSITMELKQVGQTLKGNYFYDKYRKNVAIEGFLQEDNTIILKEIDPSGNKTSSIFMGQYSRDWNTITGVWENTTKDRRFSFDLTAIRAPFGQKRAYTFDNIRWFQELLNYFDLEPELPFSVYKGIEKRGFRWKKSIKESARKDYQKVIPYRLAKRFIMNQVPFRSEGVVDYFNIQPRNYKAHEMHYKALCCVYRTTTYVGLLLNFSEDTGWNTYDVTFLLIYDYAGHLLDACKVGKELDLEYGGKQLKETMKSRFLADSTIEMHTNGEQVEYGSNNLDEEYYQTKKIQEQVYYILQPNGRFIRQEVDLSKNRTK